MLENASCYVWGVEGGERDAGLSLDLPNTPGLLTQPYFSVATWVITEHWVAFSTRTQNQRSPCRQGRNTRRTKGARNTPPQGTCKHRRSPQIQGCHNPTGAEEAQLSKKKKPLLGQRGVEHSLIRTLGEGMHHRAVTGNRADAHKKQRHRQYTDRHGCTRFRHNMDLCGRRQVPLEGTAGGKTCS